MGEIVALPLPYMGPRIYPACYECRALYGRVQVILCESGTGRLWMEPHA